MNRTKSKTELSRRTYLKATGVAAAGTVGLAGCAGTASATGTLATQVTDQPGDIADFESCVVTIQGIWVKPSGGDDDTETAETEGDDSGTDGDQTDGTQTETGAAEEGTEAEVDESDAREYHEFEEPQEADLVELQNGNTQLIDERELDVGTYEFLQLDVTDVEGVLDGGDEAEVDTPGSAPLQFKEPFEIREDQVTTFTGDFTPVRRGRTDRYLLQPVASGTRVEYGDEAGDGSQ
ncbi:DUF4382 domain-containing protein [Halobellus limi]|jgi:hypothetical protein|uniref:DUF4382 domain-containing protein n=1 Tax=Halobellus limi TaxID=699433 RepID=A0A1H6C473_9EURY|nr:DUF4382 domain-containing protein [Halobellus limi]QCC48610.1 DUF4382 domain-containing protein [Halobellus limi]SEG67761.1 protein of unknown function [Halobellus limi]